MSGFVVASKSISSDPDLIWIDYQICFKIWCYLLLKQLSYSKVLEYSTLGQYMLYSTYYVLG